MDKDKLVELAERCEAAQAPDRQLDVAIAKAVGRYGSIVLGSASVNFTSSLDAAMTLVPEGWRVAMIGESVIEGNDPWSVQLLEKRFDGRAKQTHDDGATAALALCAAALRSHAQPK